MISRQKPFLVVGLGNPGKQYRRNRHNAGAMVVEAFARRLEAPFARLQAGALVAETRLDGRRLILAKPQTFMNESGKAVRPLVRMFQVPWEQMLVVYDDLDLPLGMIRLRPGGGSGGHKGMQSIIEHLGTQEFPRLRIGIGRPPGRMDPARYVLQDFNRAEWPLLEETVARAVECLNTFLTEGLQAAMNRFNPREVE